MNGKTQQKSNDGWIKPEDGWLKRFIYQEATNAFERNLLRGNSKRAEWISDKFKLGETAVHSYALKSFESLLEKDKMDEDYYSNGRDNTQLAAKIANAFKLPENETMPIIIKSLKDIVTDNNYTLANADLAVNIIKTFKIDSSTVKPIVIPRLEADLENHNGYCFKQDMEKFEMSNKDIKLIVESFLEKELKKDTAYIFAASEIARKYAEKSAAHSIASDAVGYHLQNGSIEKAAMITNAFRFTDEEKKSSVEKATGSTGILALMDKIIKDKLSADKKARYSSFSRTDSTESPDNNGLGMVVGAAIIMDALSTSPSPTNNDGFGGFGGGDFGGGGAGGNW